MFISIQCFFLLLFFYQEIDSSHGSKVICVISAFLLDQCSGFLQSLCVSCCLWEKLFLSDLVSSIIT